MCEDVHIGPTSKSGQVTGVPPTQEPSLSLSMAPGAGVTDSLPHPHLLEAQAPKRGLDHVFLWVGMEERDKSLRAAWETLFKPRTRTGQACGSVWPPRRKGSWVGLHRLQVEPQDPEAADLMGFPCPTRQRRCKYSKWWRITVAWITGMLGKHMRNHSLHSATSLPPPPPIHQRILLGSGRRELPMRNCVPVLTWQSSLRLRRKSSTRLRLRVKNLVYYLAIKIVWKICQEVFVICDEKKDRIQKYMKVW